MWIINNDGFFAAIQHYDDSEKVVVRGRSRADMFRLQDAYMKLDFFLDSPSHKMDGPPLIEETPKRDYTYRMELHKDAWSEYMARAAKKITYGDFKKVMGRRFNERQQGCLMNVWMAMIDWTDKIYFLESDTPETPSFGVLFGEREMQ